MKALLTVAVAAVALLTSADAAVASSFQALGFGQPVAHITFASIAPSSVPADGTSHEELTVQATDAFGIGVPDASLDFSATSGTFGQPTYTGMNGYYDVTLTSSTTPGVVTITASSGNVSATFPTLFESTTAGAPAISASASTLTACRGFDLSHASGPWSCVDNSTSLPADGASNIEVDVCLVSSKGLPITSVSASEITFHTTLGNLNEGAATAPALPGGLTSDPSNGTACDYQTLTSTTQGTATVSVVADGVPLDATVQATFR